MARKRRGLRLLAAVGLAASVIALVAAPSTGAPASGFTSAAEQASAGTGLTGCIAHRFKATEAHDIYYTPGCTGHDEPELDPVSSAPGSARDLTWTVVLPADGTTRVDSVGPTFWFGGTVTDPHSLFGQAFYELQFYPNSIVNHCTQGGGFNVTFAPGVYSVCSPTWRVHDNIEDAAFNAMLRDGSSSKPLLMHSGQTIQVHIFATPAHDGFHIKVADLSTGHSGLIVLNSAQDGPLNPVFNTQRIGGALAWGIVNDTPNSFVWEIGHASPYHNPPDQFCIPGQPRCPSYDAAHWAGFGAPLKISSVRFGNGSQPNSWAVVSDFGGSDEVVHSRECHGTYGGPFCIYPWYTYSAADHSFRYGVDYPGTTFDFGKAAQFATTPQCGGPFGPDSTYCDTVVLPTH